MHVRLIPVVASSLLLLVVSLPAFADQKIKTKSNIKNDRVAGSCLQGCEEAGRAWAVEHRISDPADCASRSAAFTEGCKAYLKAQSVPKPPSE